MVLGFCKSISFESAALGRCTSEAGMLMGSDGFRAPYEAYDNTTKYVLLLCYLRLF